MKLEKLLTSVLILILLVACEKGQAQQVDAATKLYLSTPDYPVPYRVQSPAEVKSIIDRVLNYLEKATPVGVVDKDNSSVLDYSRIDQNSSIVKGTFSITNYMWGVTYSGMLNAAQNTGDKRYRAYVADRLEFLSQVAPYFEPVLPAGHGDDVDPQMRQMLRPEALDDAGAMCSAMIKAKLDKIDFDGKPLIDRYFDYIMNKQYRLEDGTFARNRPQKNTLWLDDMYMGIPAMANMGRLTGETRYYDEAIKQILQFAERMFISEVGLYRHGWVEAMDPHPAFLWGRANGWALLTKIDVLDAIPEGYPGREKVLELLQDHIAGISKYQSGIGFWHQLLDRNDSYLETSCTAIYVYGMARAINKGWVDELAYGSRVILGWNALSTKINEMGEVEGTCVGTGMGFDPAFYYYRPRNKYAGHGYGPVILAGSEVYHLINTHHLKSNDSALLFYKEKIETDEPIFEVD